MCQGCPGTGLRGLQPALLVWVGLSNANPSGSSHCSSGGCYTSSSGPSPVADFVQLPPNLTTLSATFSHFLEKCVMNNYFGIGLDAKISLEFNNKRDEHPKKCRFAETSQIALGKTYTPPWLSEAQNRMEHRGAGRHGVSLGLPCLAGDPFLWQVFHLQPLPWWRGEHPGCVADCLGSGEGCCEALAADAPRMCAWAQKSLVGFAHPAPGQRRSCHASVGGFQVLQPVQVDSPLFWERGSRGRRRTSAAGWLVQPSARGGHRPVAGWGEPAAPLTQPSLTRSSRTKNMMWYGVLGTKELLQRTYKNLEQRVQLEVLAWGAQGRGRGWWRGGPRLSPLLQCDGVPISLPSLQGIAVLNIPSYAGGINFWGGTKEDNVSASTVG